MPLFSVHSIVNTVSSLAADAYSNLTSNTNRSSLATATEKRLPVTPRTELAITLAQAAPLRMSESVKFHTRSVSKFLDAFEAEQRDKETGSNVQDLENAVDSRNINSAHIGRPTSSTSFVNHPSRRLEERRALGVAEKSPTDAIAVLPPMSRTPFVLKNQFRPQNTLDQPRSTKRQFYDDRTHKRVSSPGSIASNPKTVDVRENNHRLPSKKRRTDAGPLGGTSRREAIDLDGGESPITTPNQASAFINHARSSEKRRPPQGGLQRIPIKAVTVEVPKLHEHNRRRGDGQTSPLISHHFTTHSSSSSDELVTETFTKDARRQRVDPDQPFLGAESEDWSQLRKYRSASVLGSSPPETALPTVIAKAKKPSEHHAPKTLTPRMERRLQAEDESPDALQNDITTRSVSTGGTRRSQDTTRMVDATQSRLPSKDKQKAVHRVRSAIPKGTQLHQFPLATYLIPTAIRTKDSVLCLDDNEQSLSLYVNDALLGPVWNIPLKSIVKVTHCTELEQARIIILTRDHDSNKSSTFGFEFESYNIKKKFIEKLAGTDDTVTLKTRNTDHLDGFFRNYSQHQIDARSPDDQVNHAKRSEAAKMSPTEGRLPAESSTRKRQRLVDRLKTSSNPNEAELLSRSPAARAHIHNKEQQLDNEITNINQAPIPTSDEMLDSLGSGKVQRLTRSRINNKHETEVDFGTLPPKSSIFATLPRWTRPLIYPATGKKRETVQFDDLQRLDEDEFLNDNLVSLFIRYLEEHAAKDTLKKIHFFNSFLVEALTKETKARRGINFDAVRRWTVKVDLFSRDFVVVPVNENLHWYVMIICNLSYFKRARELKEEVDDEEQEVEEEDFRAENTVETPERMEGNKPEIILRSDLKQDIGETSTRNSFAEMSLEDHALSIPSNPSSMESAKDNGRRKKRNRKSLPKYDTDKPVIITLDSLDQARSSTATALRQYIVAEAKDKHNWDIESNEIKGMTAKGIPHQNNFSDCGLYLCMYLEQFILEPYEFVRKILQRSSETRWPKQIASSNLRDRLRTMLLILHEEQSDSGERTSGIPPLGSIMVQMSTPEDGTDLHEVSPSEIRAAKERYAQSKFQFPARKPDFTEEDYPLEDAGEKIEAMDDWKDIINAPIVIDDDSQPQLMSSDGRKITPSKSPYFSSQNQAPASSPHEMMSHAIPENLDPAALALKMKRERSPDLSFRGEIQATPKPTEHHIVALTNGSDHDTESSGLFTSLLTLPKKSSQRRSTHRSIYQKFKKPSVEGYDSIDDDAPPASEPNLSHASRLPLEQPNSEGQRARRFLNGNNAARGREVLREITTKDEENGQAQDTGEDGMTMLV